jgi:prophage antirepressor-like protein
MALAKRTYSVDDAEFDAWFYRTDKGDIWVSAAEVCKFLGYKDTNQAIRKNITRADWKRTYEELVTDDSGPRLVDGSFATPSNWQNHTLFINEPAFNQLICSSRKPQAKKFFEWVCEDVLPTLRRTGEFKLRQDVQERDNKLEELAFGLLESNRELVKARKEMKEAFDELAEANRRMHDLATKAISVPSDKGALHGLCVVQLDDKKVVCFRRQKRTLRPTVDRLKKRVPSAVEIFHKEEVPNATNAWIVTKEHLKAMDPKMKAKANNVTLDSLNPSDVSQVLENVTTIKCKTIISKK